VYLGRLQRLFQRQRRQNRGQPLGEHGFAGAGRTNEQDVINRLTSLNCYI
jgi:hypothetical protein